MLGGTAVALASAVCFAIRPGPARQRARGSNASAWGNARKVRAGGSRPSSGWCATRQASVRQTSVSLLFGQNLGLFSGFLVSNLGNLNLVAGLALGLENGPLLHDRESGLQLAYE